MLSRTDWAVRLLRLPCSRGTSAEPGLILIQIDGLSRRQIEHALARGRMPFLRRLIRREDYVLHPMYSGVPSTTPAVQGELFYGVKAVVPAFQFRDHETGEMTSLLSTATALRVEQRLSAQGENLLQEGSAYADIYAAGPEQTSFSCTHVGISRMLKQAGAWRLLAVFVLHAFVVARMALLAVVELGLALYDVARRWSRRDLFQEIKFIPTRVALVILMRELAALGARIDAVRGVPIIHCNFVGYDEQSHRRGPSSFFAHWALKGIDGAIRSIWRSARRSNCRRYDVWIYSDHGQESATSYALAKGRTIHEAVAEVLERQGIPRGEGGTASDSIQTGRAQWFGGHFQQRLQGRARPDTRTEAQVAAMGPLGFIYTPQELDAVTRDRVGEALQREAEIPAVLAREGPGRARAWTEHGVLNLPEQAAELLGADHPFLKEAASDLMNVVHHADAGAFTILGWRPDGRPMTFPIENGAHGGPGSEETAAFALMPEDVPILAHGNNHLRPCDLRNAAARLIDGVHHCHNGLTASPDSGVRILRLMTYNVHSCIGMDGKHSPERIARVIARYAPDVVALQELDLARLRTGQVDQARLIAQALNMTFHFHPSFRVEEESYGNAVLSRLPMRLVKAGPLPLSRRREPRGALWVELEFNGRRIQLINTHLGLRPGERRHQMEALLGEEWLGHCDCLRPAVLCGDLNSFPRSRIHRMAAQCLCDLHRAALPGPPRPTWMGLSRLDYIFASSEFRAVAANVPHTLLARTASDHWPLVVDVEVGPPVGW